MRIARQGAAYGNQQFAVTANFLKTALSDHKTRQDFVGQEIQICK
tara:strand:- start:1073 stop:1207 length:135 start_codon:yes stop_codon:yes gene_type:complete